MKVYSGRNMSEKKSFYERMGTKLEMIMLLLFAAAFTLLLGIQAAIVYPSTRSFITDDSIIEGVPLQYEETLYKEGILVLECHEVHGSMKLLVNGEEAHDLFDGAIEIKIKDGDVLEIDGGKLEETAYVEIVSQSDNFENDNTGITVKVKSKIEKLLRVRIKD